MATERSRSRHAADGRVRLGGDDHEVAQVSEGEPIARDEPLLEISTDKVDTEVPSPAEGVVAQILVQEGETVEVGTVLAVIAPEGAAPAPTRLLRSAGPSRPRRTRPTHPRPQRARRARPRSRARRPRPRRPAAPASGNGRTFVSPVVARIASEHGVDPNAVQGTGTGGRVTKKDILAFVESGGQAAAPAAPAAEPRRPHRARTGSSRAPARQAPPAPAAAPAPHRTAGPRGSRRSGAAARRRRRAGSRRERRAAARRDARADDRDAQGHRRAHAPLARHLRARHERDRGRHVEGRRDPREAEAGVPGGLRRQPDLSLLRRPRRRSRRCATTRGSTARSAATRS